MRTKGKYTKLCALLFMLVMLLTACGAKNTDNNATPPTTNEDSDIKTTESTTTENTVTESATDPVEDVNIEDWGTSYFDAVAESGQGAMLTYSIKYPDLIPKDLTDIVVQRDIPVCIALGYGGTDYRAKNVEDVLPACIEHIVEYMGMFRGALYDDFTFNIETQKSITINDFPACNYTGTHSFTTEGNSYEVPFSAYSFDLKADKNGNEAPEAYIYIIVIDESVLHPNQEAVAEGDLEDYAYKMALSVKVR